MLSHLSSRARWDLHIHSSRSDGRLSPEDVLSLAAKRRLDVIALTDHDLSTGLEPGPRMVNGHELHIIAGAELSGLHDGHELHLLVYFPKRVPSDFAEFCKAQCQRRADRYNLTIDRLGLPLTRADQQALVGDRSLTRLHLANALVEGGYVNSRREAFDRFVGNSTRNVPRMAVPFVQAIQIARAAGGLTSWAHPVPYHIDRYLETFIAAGLQGVEGLRPSLNSRDRNRFKKLARKHGLFLTGGSDFHGWAGEELGLYQLTTQQLGPFFDAIRAA